MSHSILGLFGLLSALLLGCAGQPPAPPKALQQPAQTMQLGMAAWRNDELSSAQLLFAKAAQQYRSIDHADGEFGARLNLAAISLVLGKPQPAQQQLDAAKRLHVASDDTADARMTLLQAQTWMLEANYSRALLALESLLVAPQTGSLRDAVLLERARLAGLQKTPIRPWLEELGDVSDQAPRIQASRERMLARAAQESGNTAEQEAHLNAALELYRQAFYRPGIAATHSALGDYATQQREWQQADEHYRIALDIQLWMHDQVHAQQSLRALARTAQELGQPEEAAVFSRWQQQLDDSADADGAPRSFARVAPLSGGE